MVEALAMTLVDIPITLCTILPFVIIVYFSVGLQRTAGQFLCVCEAKFTFFPLTSFPCNSIFTLIIFTNVLAMKALFRVLAAALKSQAPAQTLGGLSLLALSLYAGYITPLPSMIKALKWISYIDVR